MGLSRARRTLVFATDLDGPEEFGKHSIIERFSGRAFLFFRLQRPPLSG
jgi:hypothetical protein